MEGNVAVVQTDLGTMVITANGNGSYHVRGDALTVNRVPVRMTQWVETKDGVLVAGQAIVSRTDRLYPGSEDISWNARDKMREVALGAAREAASAPAFILSGERNRIGGRLETIQMEKRRLRERLDELNREEASLRGELTSIEADYLEAAR